MSTLLEIKKQNNLKNKDIARIFHCSNAKAGMILQGRYISTFSDEEIQKLANVLNITFERCWYSMQESYRQFFKNEPPQIRCSERFFKASQELQTGFPELNFFEKVPRPLTTIESNTIERVN